MSAEEAGRWAQALDINTRTGSIARSYDYLLDGKDNFDVDREASA